MIVLDSPTFIVQRRINAPSDRVLRTISNPEVFGAGCVLAADREGSFRLDEAFRRIDLAPRTTWCANARLLSPAGHTIAVTEVELGPWSVDETELVICPCARNPQRWSGRRMRRYFHHAHRRADDIARLLTRTSSVEGTAWRHPWLPSALFVSIPTSTGH
ncbi:MAG: hypothetical protein ACLPVY_08835 [Acidimicrobiia bacterium]